MQSPRFHITLPALLLVLLLVLTAQPAGAQAFDDDPDTVVRVDEGSAVDGAVAVSRLRFPGDGSARLAVLATDQDFADALAGALLTFGDDRDPSPSGPLLLTGASDLDPLVADELERVLPADAEVLILGGTAALDARVLEQVEDLGFAPRRISGSSRFETAAAIARERAVNAPVTTYLLARGDAPAGNPTAAWADAISGSVDRHAAILLTPQASLHPAASQLLSDDETDAVVLLGGTGALSQRVEDAVPGALDVTRLAGATRDGTAVEFARARLGITQDTPDRRVVMFDGYAEDGWAYGLPAATLARDNGAALVPVNTDALATATATLVGCGAPADVLVMGDESVLPDATVQAHRECPPTPPSAAPFVLNGSEPLPDAIVGGPVQPAIDAVADLLGPPTRDTGWVEGCPLDADGDLNERYVDFGDSITLSFYRYADGDVFSNWRYLVPSPLGFTTDRGLGSGATNADIDSAYPEATLIDDSAFGPYWEIPTSAGGPMTWFVAGNGPDDQVEAIYGGDVLYCD